MTLQVKDWQLGRRRGNVRQQLLFTLPAIGGQLEARSSLEEAVQACRRRGGSPNKIWVASPFFDADNDASRVTASLCKLMARGGHRELTFCVPAIRGDNTNTLPQLCAPIALLKIPPAYQSNVLIEMLPECDRDKNRRPWHAKMLAFIKKNYFALMIGYAG